MAGGTDAAFCVSAKGLSARARLCAAAPSNALKLKSSRIANAVTRPALVRPRLTWFGLAGPRLAGCEVRRFMVWLLHSALRPAACRPSRQERFRSPDVAGLPELPALSG